MQLIETHRVQCINASVAHTARKQLFKYIELSSNKAQVLYVMVVPAHNYGPQFHYTLNMHIRTHVETYKHADLHEIQYDTPLNGIHILNYKCMFTAVKNLCRCYNYIVRTCT